MVKLLQTKGLNMAICVCVQDDLVSAALKIESVLRYNFLIVPLAQIKKLYRRTKNQVLTVHHTFFLR
ncbi:MAG: hypothetical protein ACJAX3_001012 [Patiriisocius sp.]|jgi:hypothetical protein